MSDLEKVYSYAVSLGSNTPVQLRWEGAGDSAHAASLLGSLKYKNYPGTSTRIKYHAVLNIYEADTSSIYATAAGLMARVHGWGTTNDQTYEMRGSADVTRVSGALGQAKAHIIFVRNIMPTNNSGESLTNAGTVLHNIHTGALRNRANSLNDQGHLRLGMSGAPGLASASHQERVKMPANKLFVNAQGLVDNAELGGLTVSGALNRLGAEDYDEGGVMKNNGVSLGIKKTFYLTFVK